MEPNGGASGCLRGLHHIYHILQGHGGTVIDGTVLLLVLQKRRIYQRAGIDDHIRFPQKPCAADSDEVRGSGARANKVDHSSLFLSV